MNRLVGIGVVLAAVSVAGATAASACAICLSAVSVSAAKQIDKTDRAVLAVPEGAGFRVVALVKGGGAPGEFIPLAGLVPTPPTPPAGQALFLLHNAFAVNWKSIGATRPESAAWLREIAATAPPDPDAVQDILAGDTVAERLKLSVQRLEDPDPMVARIAHDEIARAPYAALFGIAGQLDVKALRAWIAAPGDATRRSTYILLLGIAGGFVDADAIEAELDAARAAQSATDVSALLAADLELRGPDRLEWVEHVYLADPTRTLPEIEAALLALSVQGGADTTIGRERVVETYRRFIRARPAMAGFVATDLAAWKAWQASGDYAALIKAKAVSDPAEEFAIISYLQESPDPEAKAVLARD
ncbi:hypothetical protein V5F77_25755 [Xanthobacter sp. DSM 24535]|uniref:hypothetical protein n=1 Tax=Roseixanthobacter psychrophilus TaxID=3119917 RepID=UPI00372C0F1C